MTAIGHYETAMRDYGFAAVRLSLRNAGRATSGPISRTAFRAMLRATNTLPPLKLSPVRPRARQLTLTTSSSTSRASRPRRADSAQRHVRAPRGRCLAACAGWRAGAAHALTGARSRSAGISAESISPAVTRNVAG